MKEIEAHKLVNSHLARREKSDSHSPPTTQTAQQPPPLDHFIFLFWKKEVGGARGYFPKDAHVENKNETPSIFNEKSPFIPIWAMEEKGVRGYFPKGTHIW